MSPKLLIALFLSGAAMAQQVFRDPKSRCWRFSREVKLTGELPEGSGMVAWDGRLWAINDSGAPAIFTLDTATSAVTGRYDLPLRNRDWEDLAQDDDYLYLCDTGNNAREVKTLHIFRIGKKSLLGRSPKIDTLAFDWPKTEVMGKKKRVNFDCEAVAAIGDSLYLFTKEWRHARQTRLFSIPKKPGRYTAHYRASMRTKVLVTGAAYDKTTKTLALCGYNLTLRPFVFIFGDFDPESPLKNCRKIAIRKQLRQTEGIATFDGRRFFIINENFHFWLVSADARLNSLDTGANR
jgi:hypothetical protein